MVSKTLYLKREAEGLCVRCGESRDDSATKQCLKCINSAKVKRDDKRKKLIVQKLCILCGVNNIAIHDKYCNDCHIKKREIDKKSYQTKVINNQCVKCGNPSTTSYCKPCSVKQLENLIASGGSKQVVFNLYKTECSLCNNKSFKDLMLISKNPNAKIEQQTKDFFESVLLKARKNKPVSAPPEFVLICQSCLRNRSIKTANQKTNLLNKQQQPIQAPLLEDFDS